MSHAEIYNEPQEFIAKLKEAFGASSKVRASTKRPAPAESESREMETRICSIESTVKDVKTDVKQLVGIKHDIQQLKDQMTNALGDVASELGRLSNWMQVMQSGNFPSIDGLTEGGATEFVDEGKASHESEPTDEEEDYNGPGLVDSSSEEESVKIEKAKRLRKKANKKRTKKSKVHTVESEVNIPTPMGKRSLESELKTDVGPAVDRVLTPEDSAAAIGRVLTPDNPIAKKQDKWISKMQRQIAEEYQKAIESNERLEVWTRSTKKEVELAPPSLVDRIAKAWPNLDGLKSEGYAFDVVESDGLNELSPFDNIAVDEVNGIIKEGAWLRVRNGVTMDSGSSVFVVPSDWLQMFPVVESEGSRRGQTYVAAAKDGKPIVNEGEKVLKFFTGPSMDAERRKLTCQVAKVNKILASVAGFCDAGNEVIFRRSGGIIRHEETKKETPFRRVGNIYVMDAYLPNPDHKEHPDGRKQPDFTRPEAR